MNTAPYKNKKILLQIKNGAASKKVLLQTLTT